MYYVAASFVLPNSPSETTDYDAHYMKHRRIVLGITLACFILVLLLRSLEAGELRGVDSIVISYVVVMTLTLLAPGRRANIAGLGALLVIDVLTFVPQLVGL